MNEKAMIIYLHTEGLSFTQIAKQLDLSVNTVKSFYNRNKDKQFCLFCGRIQFNFVLYPLCFKMKKDH